MAESPVSQDRNDSALGELMHAARVEWSGELLFSSGGRDQGLVFFDHGRIAWAISAGQQEDLATFLWRLGRISREQVAEVRRQYERHKGARKLGRLLGETGQIKPQVLRRCLLLHTRMAITSFLTGELLEASWQERALSADQEMTFAVKEVLPELLTPEQVSADDPKHQPWWSWHRRNTILEGLDQAAGYLGAAVVSREGELLAADGKRELFEPVELGYSLASTLGSAGQAVTSATLGGLGVIFVTAEYGSVATRWIDDDGQALVFLLVDRDGRLATCRYVLNAAAPWIARALRRWSDRGLASPTPAPLDPDDTW